MSSRFPAALLGLALALASSGAWASDAGPSRTARSELGRLIVLSQGRPMPLDSFARLVLYQISGRRSVGREDALDWLARLIFDPDSTRADPVFLVNHPDALAALGLQSTERGRSSYAELEPAAGRLARLVAEIGSRPEGAADLVEADLLRLSGAVAIYRALAGSLDFARPDPMLNLESPGLRSALALDGDGPLSLLEVMQGLELARESGSPLGVEDRSGIDAASFRWFGRGGTNPLKVVPVAHGSERWLSPESAMLDGGDGLKLAAELGRAELAWSRGDWRLAAEGLAAFNAGVSGTSGIPGSPRLEILYNRSRPFLVSALFSLAALLFALATGRVPLPSSVARAPLIFALAVHSAALVLRVAVTGRPPVTSLYSSFLFVAWVLLATGLLLSRRQGERLGLILGPLGAFLLIVVSGKFAAEGDQLGVLQAVLDSNFWLSTHVVSITVGYGGALASGLLGHAYLLRKIARPADEAALSRIARLLERMLMFALLFTFLGTMLGGIWADQSWGRFWGWDPKENGAMLIVLWIAILQHARLGRMIDHQGLATGSVLLVLVLLFSWIGVNLMGAGLHSYGWTQGSLEIALIVFAVEVVFALLASTAARLRELPSPELRKARVRALWAESPDTVTVSLEVSPERRLACRPGAFLTLFAKIDGVTYRRAYSLSAMSRLGDRFDITVKRIPEGVVSAWVARELRVGTRLAIAGPSGDFGLDGEMKAPSVAGAVFVAAGSGIAPLMPMAEEYFGRGGRRLLLLYGSKDERHIIFRERLERLAAAEPGFEVRHVLDEPLESWAGARGRLTGASVLREVSRPLEMCYYLCGPESMVDEVRGALLDAGVLAGRIREERFSAGLGRAARERSAGGLVRLRSSGRELKVPAGQSILEAALRAGVPMPHGCVAGRCRECAVRLLAGRAAMEEPNALSAAEREGGVLLVCVAYPDGRVELDA